MGSGLTQQEASAVYDVLVAECGASESGRDHFVFTQTREHVVEWRFIGRLGFGGKFWRTTSRRPDDTWGELWRVDCYPEDSTAEREAMIEGANAALWEVQASR